MVIPEDESYRLWVLLRGASHVNIKVRDRELRRYGISSVEAGVLAAINAMGKYATVSKIAREVLQEAHSISELVGRMEKKQLVKRLADPNRKNTISIKMTPMGEKAYLNSMKLESAKRVMNSLSDEERKQLVPILQKLISRGWLELGTPAGRPYPRVDRTE